MNANDNTAITCVDDESNFVAGFFLNSFGIFVPMPLIWDLTENIIINPHNNKNARRASQALYTPYSDGFSTNGMVLGLKKALDGNMWYFGYVNIFSGNTRINDNAVIWKLIKSNNPITGFDRIKFLIPNSMNNNTTPTISVGMSSNEQFVICGAIELSPFYQRQIMYPSIYDRINNRYVPTNLPQNFILKYSIESSYQLTGDPIYNIVSTSAMTKNAKFIGMSLYLTSDITFTTDRFEYNPNTINFEIVQDNQPSPVTNFTLLDHSINISENALSLFGIENKAKTLLDTMSVANQLEIYTNLQPQRPEIASNVYILESAYPLPTAETKLIQFNTSIQVANNISTINFSSNLLPISKSSVATPLIFNEQIQGNRFVESSPQSGENNAISNIVTDFTQFLQDGSENRDMLLYNPTGEYRLINLINNQPVRDIDLSVTYTDNYGITFPLMLRPQCSATIKLLFRKKNFYARN
jgi:hypothetical protein